MGIVQSYLSKIRSSRKSVSTLAVKPSIISMMNYACIFALGCAATSVSANANIANVKDNAKPTYQSRNHALVLEMTPAMCLFYPSRMQMRQCQEGYRVTVETLDLGYDCMSSTTPVLSPVQEKVVRRIMPDDTFIRQAWRRYGVCSPYSASEYFRLVTRYTSELKLPTELTQVGQYRVDKNAFSEKFKRLNPGIGIKRIYFSCQQAQQQSILTKIEICYANNNRNNCPQIADTCQDQMTIWGNAG